VTTEGTVKDPIIVSKPDKYFDRAALRAILKYKFAPKTINKKPVESLFIQTIKFELDED